MQMFAQNRKCNLVIETKMPTMWFKEDQLIIFCEVISKMNRVPMNRQHQCKYRIHKILQIQRKMLLMTRHHPMKTIMKFGFQKVCVCSTNIKRKIKSPFSGKTILIFSPFFPWNIFISIDPSEWNKLNIKSWLDWITKEFKLNPAPVLSRFPSNGKELVELSRAEFFVCAGSREGGNKLAEHIAYLIHDATGRNIRSLLHREDPGISFFLFSLYFISFIYEHIFIDLNTFGVSIEHSSTIIIIIYFRISNSIADW